MNLTLRLVAFALLCSLPGLDLLWRLLSDQLGANPVEVLTHTTGEWAIYSLLLTLSITPIQHHFKPDWNRYLVPMHLVKRVLGLTAFVYGLLHFSVYFVFDMALSIQDSLQDIAERPFILVGMLAFVLLLPLALTSTQGWQKRLKKRWKTLHKTVYLITFLGILHYIMLVKADLFQPLLLMAVFAGLMWLRKQPFRSDHRPHKP